MRIVVDSNVYISGLTVGGLSQEVLACVLTDHEVFLTKEILAEVERAFRKKFKYPPDLVREQLDFLRLKAREVKITGKLKTHSRDPDDNHVLEAALVCRAHLLVTGDQDLLSLAQFEATKILNPRQFLQEHT